MSDYYEGDCPRCWWGNPEMDCGCRQRCVSAVCARASTQSPAERYPTLADAFEAIGKARAAGALPMEAPVTEPGWNTVALLPRRKYRVREVEDGWEVLAFDQQTADMAAGGSATPAEAWHPFAPRDTVSGKCGALMDGGKLCGRGNGSFVHRRPPSAGRATPAGHITCEHNQPGFSGCENPEHKNPQRATQGAAPEIDLQKIPMDRHPAGCRCTFHSHRARKGCGLTHPHTATTKCPG